MRRYLFALILCLCTVPVLAQQGPEHLSPFAHGAGRTYAITARGLDAAGLNPALLAIPLPKPVEFSLVPVTSLGVETGPSFSKLNDVSGAFTGQDSSLSDSARAAIIDLLFNNKLSGRADARLLGFEYSDSSFGGLALTWTMHSAVKTSLPDALLTFFGANAIANLTGFNHLHHATNLDVQGLWYSAYGISYGRNLLPETESGLELLAGVGLKYVVGIGYLRLDPSSYISINDPSPNPEDYSQVAGGTGIVAQYKMQFAYPAAFDPNNLPTSPLEYLSFLTSSGAGSGFGADVGLVLGQHSSSGAAPWRLALSVDDIGSITWNNHTDIRKLDRTKFQVKFGSATNESVNDSLRGLGGVLDTTDAPFTSKLPTTLHVAGAMNLAGLGIAPAGFEFSGAAEYALGLTDVVGSPSKGRFGLTLILERPSTAFSFHTALGFTTQESVSDLTFAIGFGVANTVLLDVGTAGVTNLFKSTGESDLVASLKILL